MSQRELEIMQLIAQGLSNKDIAGRLGIVPDTVKSHVRRILERLGLHNRVQIAVYVRRIAGSQTESSDASAQPGRGLRRRPARKGRGQQ